MTREEVIKNAKSLIDSNQNIALQMPTNMGKSRIAIELVKHCFTNPKLLLVVNEVPHKKNWMDEFKKWGSFKNITVICYASLKNYTNTKWDAIIWDEAHHLGTPLRISYFETVTAKHHIFLSATLSKDFLSLIKDILGNLITYKVTLDEAIKSNIIPQPQIYLVKLNLNLTNRDEGVIEEWGSKYKRVTYTVNYPDRWKYKRNKSTYPDVKLIIKCTEFEKYNYLCEQVEYWKKRYMVERYDFIKNKWLQYGSQRKRYLGELKTPYAHMLINKLKDKRFICFCTSILQAEALGSKTCIHSKMNNPLSVIDKFNRHKINSLFACQMITEGQNLKDIEAGIIIQLDGQELKYIQKTGRVLRAEHPVQFVLYYDNTRDSEYLKKVLEITDKNYVKTITIDDLDEVCNR